MATLNTGAARQIDLLGSAKYNVQLGESLKDATPQSTTLSAVAFNHKPSQTTAKRSTTLTSFQNDLNTYALVIHDEDEDQNNKTEYHGRCMPETASYLLVLNDDQQTFTMEALNQEYRFNMVSAPWEKNATVLQEQHKQISMDGETHKVVDDTSSEKDDELFGQTSGEPDPGNPFDYRHYLTMQPEGLSESRNPSHAGTPILPAVKKPVAPPRAQQKPPARRPVLVAKPRPKPRRPQSPVFMAPRKSTSPARRNPQGSSPEPSDAEENAFVLDLGENTKPLKRRPDAIGIYSTNGRPVSLRTVATSGHPTPVPSIRSPAPQDIGSGYEEDNESVGTDGEEAVKENDDDVDDLELPGPAVQNAEAPAPRRYSTWDKEDEAELDAELMELLAEDEDVEAEPEQAVATDAEARKLLTRKREDSDSESEEE